MQLFLPTFAVLPGARILALALFVLSTGSAIHAQDVATSPGASALPSGLKEGQWIRIREATSGRWEGRFGGVAGDSIRLFEVAGTEHRFAISSLDTVWVQGTAAKTGAIAGGIALVPLGVLAGAFFDYACGDPDSGGTIGGSCPLAYVGGVAVFGGLGALIGAGIGSLIPKWHRRK